MFLFSVCQVVCMFARGSVFVSICVFIVLHGCLYVGSVVCLLVCLYVFLYVCKFARLFDSKLVYMSMCVCQFCLCVSVCLSAHSFVCLSIPLFSCWSVCVHIYVYMYVMYVYTYVCNARMYARQ